jgi:hypothetical protein
MGSVRNGFDAFWGELAPCAHVVQIYENDAVFLQNLAEFVFGGLIHNEAAIVIATPQHREGLIDRLQRSGVSVGLAQARGDLILLDAGETMSQFLIDGWPDDVLFEEVIGGVLARATRGGRKVRAFGEMVALMWADGHCGAVIRLEHLWSDLCRNRSFSLFCAYPKAGFTTDASDDIARVCAAHSAVHEPA